MAVGLAVCLHRGVLAPTLVAHYQNVLVLGIIDYCHSDYLILTVVVQDNALHTGAHTSHGTDVGFIEANGTAIAVGNDDFICSVGEVHGNHPVFLTDIDGVHTIGSGTAVLCQTGLLDDTVLGGEDNVV